MAELPPETDEPDEDEPDEFEEIAELMEGNGGANFGTAAGHGTYRDRNGYDGQVAPTARRSLNTETRAARDFAGGDSATFVHPSALTRHGAVNDHARGDGNRTLMSAELSELDREQVRADALKRLGFSEAELTRLDRPGGFSPERRALQVRFDARLLEVQEAGGRPIDLALALGWRINIRTSPRMAMALRRARARRDAREEGKE